jgi:hypothetical protein
MLINPNAQENKRPASISKTILEVMHLVERESVSCHKIFTLSSDANGPPGLEDYEGASEEIQRDVWYP